jgi:hypothetical protein
MQTKDIKTRLVYYGLEGAAWLMLYASDVLRLPVCLIHKDGRTHPVSGIYSPSVVLLFPEHDMLKSILENTAEPSDIIVTATQTVDLTGQNWLVSCGEDGVDFFKLLCGWDMKDRQEVGNTIYSIASEYAECLARPNLEPSAASEGSHDLFVPYYTRDAFRTSESLAKILHLMGLPRHCTDNKDWRDKYFIWNQTGTRYEPELNLSLFSAMPCPRDNMGYDNCLHAFLKLPELSLPPAFCPRCQLLNCVLALAYYTSHLVFSDWAQCFRKISTSALSIPDWRANEHFRLAFHHCETFRDANHHTQIITQLCCGSTDKWLLDVYQGQFIGLNLDGVLLIENAALDPSLRGNPRFVIREGEFSFNGDRRSLLVHQRACGPSVIVRETGSPTMPIQPSSLFKCASLKVWAALRRDAIALRYALQNIDTHGTLRESGLEVDVDIHKVIDGLRRLLVSRECSHDPMAPHPALGAVLGKSDDEAKNDVGYLKDTIGNVWFIRDALVEPILGSLAEGVVAFHLFPVLGKSLGQWTSTAFNWSSQDCRRPSLVLQGRTCLTCISKCFGYSDVGNTRIICGSGVW